MSNDETQPAPKWFSRVAWVLFVWNLLGLMAFVMQVTMSLEQLDALPEAQRALYEGYASWATLAFGVAVIGGTAGTLALALRKALALPLLVASLVGVVIQKIYDFVVIDSVAVFGPTAVILPALVFGLAVLLVLMAQKGKANHWLLTMSSNHERRAAGLSLFTTVCAVGSHLLGFGCLLVAIVTDLWVLFMGVAVVTALGSGLAVLAGASSLVMRYLSKTGGSEWKATLGFTLLAAAYVPLMMGVWIGLGFNR